MPIDKVRGGYRVRSYVSGEAFEASTGSKRAKKSRGFY